jgi:UDP-N-acetylmuramyl pentapeptide phosphotransferase/UDP-N-acetylglucosamine-1-phosphate transferase
VTLALAALAGAVVAVAAWRALEGVFAQPLFARRNFRGADVPVGAGLVLAVAAIVVEAGWIVVERARDHVVGDRGARLATLLVVVGFSFLGLLDDLAAEGDDRGFRGHLRAMARGRLTTGGVKLLGGGLLGLVAASTTAHRGLGVLVLDAAVVALAANLGNLFDRAPGRTIKVGLVAAVALVAAASAADRSTLVGVAVVAGASVGLLGFDLRERLMLGDAGSNVVGAALGFGLVLTTGSAVRIAVLVVLVLLNLASERVSFSRVIDAVAPLRFVDRLGRKPV